MSKDTKDYTVSAVDAEVGDTYSTVLNDLTERVFIRKRWKMASIQRFFQKNERA